MTRPRGGIIGVNATLAATAINSAASGVWTLREAEANRRAGTWPTSFANPTSLPGLQLWLDAADSATLFDATTGGSLVAADGGVARWEDKSGNARHATQGTSANRPLRKTAIQGGKDVLRFDGSNDTLTIPNSASMFNYMHDGDNTIFIVYKAGTTSNPNTLYWVLTNTTLNGSGGSFTGFTLRTDDRSSNSYAATSVYIVFNRGEPRYVGIAPNNSFPANTFLLQTIVSNPQDATIANRAAIRRNGGSALSLNTQDTNSAISLPSGSATYDLSISGGQGSTPVLNGDIGEIIFYDSALSDDKREAVEKYLLAKWGIT